MNGPSSVPRADDLSVRISRLEELLSHLEQSHLKRPSETQSDVAMASPVDRLREVAAILRQRADNPECDDADAIALRVLVAEFRSVVQTVRELASDVDSRLDKTRNTIEDARARLRAIEEIT